MLGKMFPGDCWNPAAMMFKHEVWVRSAATQADDAGHDAARHDAARHVAARAHYARYDAGGVWARRSAATSGRTSVKPRPRFWSEVRAEHQRQLWWGLGPEPEPLSGSEFIRRQIEAQHHLPHIWIAWHSGIYRCSGKQIRASMVTSCSPTA